MRKKYDVFNANQILSDAVEEYFPLSENFMNWKSTDLNYLHIQTKLHDPRLYILHRTGSPQDIANYYLNGNKHIKLGGFFPVSQEFSDNMAYLLTDWEKFEANLEKKQLGVDESEQDDRNLWSHEDYWRDAFGNPSDPLTEDEETSYTSDFDRDGWFLPLDNQNNSTDYQDDFDPLDYDAELWQSPDEVDDHHNDAYFKDVAITETPEFDENGKISWQLEDYESPE